MTPWVLGTLLAFFVLAVFRGAPWLPTRRRETKRALELLELQPGQTVVDLGSGSGGFLSAAAHCDLRAIGYEINPILCLIAYVRTWPQRDKVRIVWGDYWLRELPECEGIYVFLIGHFMTKLDDKLRQEAASGTKIVSYVFELPTEPEISEGGLHLYKY